MKIICTIVILYFVDLTVTRIYCGLKRKKDEDNKIQSNEKIKNYCGGGCPKTSGRIS